MKYKVYIYFILLYLLSAAAPLSAQDTTHTQRLQSVVISGTRQPTATLSQAPVQVVNAERIEQSGALMLSDALRQMAGITLKDYGGIGGMKTVSARGLGSQFSTLTLDGVPVNDCQNGQVDLGRYMVGNSAYISLSNGQQEEMLLSARATAAGSIINMQTLEPRFLPGEKTRMRMGMEGGSFGLLSPTLAWDQRLGPRTTLSFWGNYLSSKGNYPFTLYYTQSRQDSSSVERRDHSAVWLLTGDVNLTHHISSSRLLTGKVHYVRSYHQLPGPVILYNVEKGTEETHEQLFFGQVKYRQYGDHIDWQLIGKYQFSTDIYENYNALTASGYQQNSYLQHEGYASGSLLWHISLYLQATLSNDAALTTLHSNLSRNSDVQRLTWLSVAALQYKRPRLTLKGNLLATLVDEQASDIDSTIAYRRLSPYAGISIKPFANSRLRLRYFYKETYRVPNFNEMYYFTISRNLRPEKASQHNIGITLPLAEHRSRRDSNSVWHHTMTLDLYNNQVTDKIIAVPTQSMFLWSMTNLGRVSIKGLDFNGEIAWDYKSLNVTATITYTYQKALNATDPDERTYGHQIPYTPRHSGGATLYFANPWVNIGYNLLLVGERYSKEQNNDNSRLPAYADHGITLDHTFQLRLGDLRLQAQVLNLLDKQYEVVKSYPMMGRNYRLKLTYSF